MIPFSVHLFQIVVFSFCILCVPAVIQQCPQIQATFNLRRPPQRHIWRRLSGFSSHGPPLVHGHNLTRQALGYGVWFLDIILPNPLDQSRERMYMAIANHR